MIMSRRPSQPQQALPASREPVTLRLVRGLLAMPRPARIALTAIFALAVTFGLSPVIDAIYLRYFFDEATRILPSLAAAAAGLGMYVVGWLLTVGTVDEPIPARSVVLWYCALGLLAVVLAAVMLAAGLVSGTEAM